MNRFFLLVWGVFICLTVIEEVGVATAQEQQSRYVTLLYADLVILQDFNSNLELNGKLDYAMRHKNVISVADEVLAKVDIIIEKVQIVLDMFPDNYHVQLVLLPTAADVAAIYKQKYGKDVNHIAYYSISEKTIYISSVDACLRVVAHEVGHSVVDHYFQQIRPPYNIHELMAQFAEQHVTD
jgi:hypothetical protein